MPPSKEKMSAVLNTSQEPCLRGMNVDPYYGTKTKQMNGDVEPVRLRREVGLVNCVTVIVGCIVGSGIFLSPRSVLEYSGSVGMSLVVWTVSGVFSLLGALCFAELGTTITKSGGEYAYILQAFGQLPAFILLWVTLLIINPTGQSITALTFANYVVQPFYIESDCGPPDIFVRLLAVMCISDQTGGGDAPQTAVSQPGREPDSKGDRAESIGDSSNDSRIALKPEIGLFSSSTIIVGCIVGSGIFLSPKSVLDNAGSVGMSMVVWVVSGIFSLIGALCFAELGTTIPKSGGEYAYIMASFGDLPAFLLLWVTLIIINPTGQTIVALTFAFYVVQPFYPLEECPPPDSFVRLMAILCLALLTFVNSWSVPWATRVQDVFTVAKVLALVVIIGTGLVWIFMGNTENFQEPFKGSEGGRNIALAFYGGLFAYAAWNYLNYLTEEIKEPTKNLPRGIMISLPMVTIIYVLANVAYFAVLSPTELAASNAVAVTFGQKIFGRMAWIMPVSVAMSTFGGVNGGFLSLSRLFFVGAREGQLPEWLAMIQVNRKTPMPSLVFTCLMSVLYVFVPTIDSLLNYFSFMTWLSIGAAVAGLIYLRITQPNLERPIKFNILLPITFVLACIFLVVMGTVAAPMDTLIGIAITLTGFPVYFLCVWYKKKPACIMRINQKITIFVQKLLVVVSEEKEA